MISLPARPLRNTALLCGWLALGGLARDVSAEEKLPSFESVTAVVTRALAIQSDYRPGDLISQGNVEPIFHQLRQMGWAVADRTAILNDLPSDRDFVVRQLRTEAGRKMMRQISGYPGGYDRLFRLAALPEGRRTVVDLIEDTGGAELIRYLTMSQGGKQLGRMLGAVPHGQHFNKPTGQIYTEQALLDRLRKSYQAAQAEDR